MATSLQQQVAERTQVEATLTHQAFHDALTGLPNRALFMDRLAHALARAVRQQHPLAVLFLDLDRFKVINDTLGHVAGDELLTTVARRLATCLRPSDTVARWGGDEFVVLLEDLTRPAEALRTADRVLDAVRLPADLNGRTVVITASAGLTFCTPITTGTPPDDLLRDADVAMYRAKAAGGGRAVLFDADMNAEALARLDLEADLRQAVARGELRVYYQPEVDLATGVIVGIEALVRWQHPTRGVVLPATFLPLAEETGLIEPLGRWVLAEACRQARGWHDQHPARPPLILSVNLSAHEFASPTLAADVAHVLAVTGWEARCLRLDITERTLMGDAPAMLATLHALKVLGVGLAIDDFGTGSCSLSSLRRFPVDTLKVDPSLVRGLEHDAAAAAMVEAVTVLAHALGMAVTVEGIETIAELRAVQALHGDRGQGYYFAMPLPAEELSGLLNRRLPDESPHMADLAPPPWQRWRRAKGTPSRRNGADGRRA